MLHGTRAIIKGYKQNGTEEKMYISDPTSKTLEITVGNNTVYVDRKNIIDALSTLFGLNLSGAKHASEDY